MLRMSTRRTSGAGVAVRVGVSVGGNGVKVDVGGGVAVRAGVGSSEAGRHEARKNAARINIKNRVRGWVILRSFE
jgi:hypothetical protein